MADWPDRLNRFIDALQQGKRPDRNLASTPEEVEELRFAARLAGSRPGYDEPDPAFLADLRARLRVNEAAKPRRVSRGGLLRAAGLWAAGLASGVGIDWTVRRLGAAAAMSPAPTPTPGPAANPALPAGKWFAVGPLSQIADQSVLAFDAGAIPAFVIREGDTVRAMSRVCTHMACILHFDPAVRQIDCPCHGANFDLHGHADPIYNAINNLPPLPPVEVRVVQGTVYVMGA
jgi:nitrite reductase/ring-hydroxylating ferredoxin subunit